MPELEDTFDATGSDREDWPAMLSDISLLGRVLADADVEQQLLEPHARVLAIGIGPRFVRTLEQAGHRVVWLEPDARFVQRDARGNTPADRLLRRLARRWLADTLSVADRRGLATARLQRTQAVLLDQSATLRWPGQSRADLPAWWKLTRSRLARSPLGLNPVTRPLLADQDGAPRTEDPHPQPLVAEPADWLRRTLLSFDLITLGNLADTMSGEAVDALLHAATDRLRPRGRVVSRSVLPMGSKTQRTPSGSAAAAWAGADRGLIWRQLTVTRPPFHGGDHTNRVVPRRNPQAVANSTSAQGAASPSPFAASSTTPRAKSLATPCRS